MPTPEGVPWRCSAEFGWSGDVFEVHCFASYQPSSVGLKIN